MTLSNEQVDAFGNFAEDAKKALNEMPEGLRNLIGLAGGDKLIAMVESLQSFFGAQGVEGQGGAIADGSNVTPPAVGDQAKTQQVTVAPS